MDTTKNIMTVEQACEQLLKSGFVKQYQTVKVGIANPKAVFAEAFITLGIEGANFEEKRKKFIPMLGYSQIFDWLSDNQGKGLWIAGDSGTGKTIIATMVIPVVLKLLHPMLTPTLIRHYQLNVKETAGQMYKQAIHSRVVIFDDMGRENTVNDFAGKFEFVPGIIDALENQKGMFIFTTNLPEGQLEQRYGTPTIDRIKGMCTKVIIKGKTNRYE